MKIAITGASGRLGQAVINLLVNDAEINSIIALDLRPPAFEDRKIEFHKHDVLDGKTSRFFAGCDAVIHLAFIVEHSGGKDRTLIDKINVEGSKNVFNACAESGVAQIVYTSSIEAYGVNPEYDGIYLDEEVTVKGHPDFYYAQNKAEVEIWLDKFTVEHPELRIAIMRPSIFFCKVPDKGFFKNVFKRRVVAISSDMDTSMHITHGDDVASACILALKNKAHGKFNVASDEPINLAHIADVLEKRLITLPKIILPIYSLAFQLGLVDIDPVWTHCFRGQGILVTSEKIRNELGWKPRYRTTSDVVRRLGIVPNPGIEFFFSSLRRTLKLRNLIGTKIHKRGIRNGSVNWSFQDEKTCTQWHFIFENYKISCERGLMENATATIKIEPVTLYSLLSGTKEWSTAWMTGKIQVLGDPTYTCMIGVLVNSFRKIYKATGLKGVLRRRFASKVLTKMLKS